MALITTVVDPRAEPVPDGWDEAVARWRLHSFWRAELLVAASWISQVPTYLVLVADAAEVVGLFHVRHIGVPGRVRGYSGPRRVRLGLAECRVYPNTTQPGSALATGLDAATGAAVFRAFERGLRRRLRPTLSGIAYRQLTAEEVPLVSRVGRFALRVQPSMELRNSWPDLDSYLAGLPRRWRARLRRVGADVDAGLRVAVEDTVPVDEACWLVDTVGRRHAGRWRTHVPVGRDYLRRFVADDQTGFVTYRDADDRLVAMTALHDNGSELLATYWGERTAADGRPADVYFDQYVRLVGHLVRTGRERLVVGKGLAAVKARYGCEPSPRWAVAGR